MKRLQRRVKGGTKYNTSAASTLLVRMNSYKDMLWARWQALSPRDQLALSALLVFLLLFVGGYGGYSIHQVAKDSKADYQEQVADYFWLRAQAGNINRNAANAQDDAAMPPASSVSALLSSSGINDAQVVAAGDAVQLSFTHASQAVVSTALSRLEQQGWQFTQLSIQQDVSTKYMQVQATISS